jgi:predicted transcriptional regulator
LERVLGTKVRIIERARQKGRIEIEYYSAEDLDRIYAAIVGDSS